METFSCETRHTDHGDHWSIVSHHSLTPLCVACLVEQLECPNSHTTVQGRYHLAMLAGLLVDDAAQIGQLMREHLTVAQHILDIIIDNYFDDNYHSISVEICVQFMDMLQLEELYMYMLDKFEKQIVDDISKVPFVVTTLGRLSKISSAYILTLIHSNGQLILHLLELHVSGQTATFREKDDMLDCSLLFLMVHLFDVDILPSLPPSLLPLVEQSLMSWMSCAQSFDVQINMLALLKKILSVECCLWDDESDEKWDTVIQGFKRVLVRKTVVLVTATVQCLILLASNPSHSHVVPLLLTSDVPEFLFDLLYTLNITQLESVYTCLQLFAEHDLFYQKCHAVYGLDSVLRSLSVALDAKNIKVSLKGFALLNVLLQRQPASVPLFVNKKVVDLTVSVLNKGVNNQSLQVILCAFNAATSLLMEHKVCVDQVNLFQQNLVQVAMLQIGNVLWRRNAVQLLSSLHLGEQELLDILLRLIHAVLMSTEIDTVLTVIAEKCSQIIVYFCECFNSVGIVSCQTFVKILNILFERNSGSMVDVSRISLTSGLLIQFLGKKSSFRDNLELLTLVATFTLNVFESLLKEDAAHCTPIPGYLRQGLFSLFFKESLQETVVSISDEDTASGLCMIFYFTSLYQTDAFMANDVSFAVELLHARGLLHCSLQRPLTTRLLLYLLVWLEGHLDSNADDKPSLEKVEAEVVAAAQNLPVEVWATPHPAVFEWLYQSHRRAEKLGTMLLENWLLHTKGTLAVDSGDSACAVIALYPLSNFRAVLLKLLMTASEEISALSKKLILALVSRAAVDSEVLLVNKMLDEVLEKLHDLFLRSLHPKCYIVNNSLQIITALLQHPDHNPALVDHSRLLRMAHHGVNFLGKVDSANQEMFHNGFSWLLSISKVINEEQHRTVAQMIVQNADLLKTLKFFLTAKDKLMSSKALAVIASISSSGYECQTPICMSSQYVLELVKQNTEEQDSAALEVLCLSLNNCSHVIQFHRTGTMLYDGPLFTPDEIRLLFCFVQQLIFSANKVTQLYASQCILKLIDYGQVLDNVLGQHLLHHPWNNHILHLLLSQSVSSGMELHIAQLIERLWFSEEELETVSRLILETVLVSNCETDEYLDLIQPIVQKACSHCKNRELVNKVREKLDSCLACSQATRDSFCPRQTL